MAYEIQQAMSNCPESREIRQQVIDNQWGYLMQFRYRHQVEEVNQTSLGGLGEEQTDLLLDSDAEAGADEERGYDPESSACDACLPMGGGCSSGP